MALEFLNAYTMELILGLCVALIITLIVAIAALVRGRKLRNRLDNFMEGFKTENVEELLQYNQEKLRDINEELATQRAEILKVTQKMTFAIQKVGMVKYNAFDDVGNNLSFSLALLDEKNNGIVISSIYGRDFTTIYGKPVRHGQTEYPLSEEEVDAMERAVRGDARKSE